VWTDRLARVLTMLALAATVLLVLFYVVIGINPAVSFNPFPPPSPDLFSPHPSPTPEEVRESARPSPTAVSTPLLFTSPTPLRPATPTPIPTPTSPFSVAVTQGPDSSLLDCDYPLLAGRVIDSEGEPLVGYPVHVWASEVHTDTVVLSGSALRYGPSGWEVAATTARRKTTWYVQLHLHNVYRLHPPLSEVVRVELPATCPQALVLFQERSE